MRSGGCLLLFVGWLGACLTAAPQSTSGPTGPKESPPPPGLPTAPFPPGNPYSPAVVELGRNLFFDGRLSANRRVSCAFCHTPAAGFSGTDAFSPGVNGKRTGRHTPTLINRAWGKTEFWDGRAPSLEDQAVIPITDPDEMGMTADRTVAAIRAIPGYRSLFAAAFGDDQVNFDRVAKALANFVRTIVSGDSAYDRFAKGDKSALTKEQKRGLEFFNGKGECAECHSGSNFTNEKFANLGVGFDRPNPDPGRQVVTHKASDFGKFKTPTLRDCARRPRFMHDGRFTTLGDVIDFYAKGGYPNRRVDDRLIKFYLDEGTKSDLLAFLASLNGTGWQKLQAPGRLPE